MMHRLRSRARRGDRGAVLVEMLLVTPFLLVLLLSVFELGMAWRAQITVTNAARAGARVGSNVTTNSMADHSILSAVGAAMNSLANVTVNYVVVFKVTGSTAVPPAACTSATAIANGGSAANYCNTYDAGDLSAVVGGSTTGFGDATCTSGKDRLWCPANRVIDQDSVSGPDTLGVAISITYPTFTKMLGSSKTITDSVAMRLEPVGALGGLGGP